MHTNSYAKTTPEYFLHRWECVLHDRSHFCMIQGVISALCNKQKSLESFPHNTKKHFGVLVFFCFFSRECFWRVTPVFSRLKHNDPLRVCQCQSWGISAALVSSTLAFFSLFFFTCMCETADSDNALQGGGEGCRLQFDRVIDRTRAANSLGCVIYFNAFQTHLRVFPRCT